MTFAVAWKGVGESDVYTREIESELEAVRLWRACERYVNLEPVSITPEPNWSKYR